MKEIVITTNKISHLGSSIGVWRWEVPLYLFLGGLAAGIMIFAAIMILRDENKKFPLSTNRIILAAPIAVSIGMFALLFDLEHKLYVWRFYTTFHITSPMSWGAWILLLMYPASIMLILGTFRKGFPELFLKVESFIKGTPMGRFMDYFYRILDFAEKHKKLFAKISIPVGAVLGIYTGVLLNSMIARPFWNSSILGPLFLVSGLSTAAALIVLLAKDHHEKTFFTRIDLALISFETVLLLLFIVSLLSSSRPHIEAARLILGGQLTPVFWIFIFGFALTIPAFLEWLELRGYGIPSALSASFVIAGGLVLRFIILEAGQITGWLAY